MRLFILFYVVILFFSSVSDAVSIPLGEPAPEFALTSINGDRITLSEQKGKTLVVIYWRTEHNRSLDSLKDGNDVITSLKHEDLTLISVIADSDDRDKAKAVMTDNGIDIPVFIDAGRKLYSDYGIRVYPTTLIIDKEGVFSKDIPSHPLSYKHLLKGHIKMALGEIDEAGLQEMIGTQREKKDDKTLEAERLYNLAMKFTKSGLQDMAVKTVKQSIEVKPDLAKSHILLGFLSLDAKDADKALENFEEAIKLEPDSKEAQTGLGGALVLKGEADRAIEVLNPATKANPYPQMTYYELGKAYDLKGDKGKSSEMYKKAIEKIIHKVILPSSVSKCQ